jgi:hypothetical protein
MKRDSALMLAILVAPGLLARIFPWLTYMSVFLLCAGTIIIVVVGHRSMFRQDKRGIFLQYSDPDKLLAMKPSESELRLIKIGICCLVSALLVLFFSRGSQVF